MITPIDILLITGGTGSFGNAVLERFLHTELFKEIRIFSRDEKKQDDMRQQYQNKKIKYFIGDVRDKRSLSNAMREVDYVFHAAALKQVPSCEFFPMEAVRTNVMGCENVLDSALENGVKKVVVLSTDKAVYPINAMGITKALSEKVMVAKSRSLNGSGTVFCGTRYGNVMASRGSVIPLFVDQIRKGQPLTLTDPHMTRFMMTLESAVDLVFFAFEQGTNGDIFVQKAPAATIEVLAEGLPHRRVYLTGSSMKEFLDYYQPKIKQSQVLSELKLGAGNYFLVSTHREENVDNPANLRKIIEVLNRLAEEYQQPVIVSTHPRTRKRLEALEGITFNPLIQWLKPFGFLDYIYLQMNAHCTLSDSGTISEESSILNFPAISLRQSMERPEAQDTGSIILTGFDPEIVLNAVRVSVAQHQIGITNPIPEDYNIDNTSRRVLKLIMGNTGLSNLWHGINPDN